MSKYFKTDFKRFLSRTNTKIGLLLSAAFVIVLNILLYMSLAGQTNLLSPGEGANGYTSSELLIILAIQAIAILLPYISFIVASYIYVDEKKEKGMLRAVECGISKTTIAISKFIESIIFCLIYAIVIFALHVLIVKILYGLDGDSLKYIIDFIKNIGILALPIISIIACMNLLSIQIKGELSWSFVTVIYAAFLDTIIKYLGVLLKSNKIIEFSSYMPSVAFKKFAQIETMTPIALNFADYKIQVIASLIFTIIFVSLSVVVINKRDLEI